MPQIFLQNGYRFHFYSSEGSPLEPMHVHIARKGVGDAKVWLYPDIAIAYTHGFDARTLRWLIALVIERRTEIESAWHEHFGTSD